MFVSVSGEKPVSVKGRRLAFSFAEEKISPHSTNLLLARDPLGFNRRRMKVRFPRTGLYSISCPPVACSSAVAAPTMTKKLLLSLAFTLVGLNSMTVPKTGAQSPVLPPAQTTPALEMIATNGADKEKHLFSQNGVVPMLMVRPNQVVPVTLQFPSAQAGTPVVAVPLDGGKIAGGNLVVLPTGKAMFTFSPGPAPGRYRVAVYLPGEQYLLEFYVVDPANPPWQRRPGSGQ
jgi:hypothetical protein